MEILFLFLGRNEIFKEDIPVNFGGRFLFRYMKEQEELTIKENPYYTEGFYQVDNNAASAIVTNTTGIIGQNGSGKSSMVNLLKSILPRGWEGIRHPLIMALINDKGERIIYHFSKEFKITKGNAGEYGFRLVPLVVKIRGEKLANGFTKQIPVYPEIEELKKLDLIYFSNIFDSSVENETDGLRNVSTNFLLAKSSKRVLKESVASIAKLNVGTAVFFGDEISKQINFLNNVDPSLFIPFPLPEKLTITPVTHYLELNEPVGDKAPDQYRWVFNKILFNLSDLLRAAIKREETVWRKAKLRLIGTCLMNTLDVLENEFKQRMPLEELENILAQHRFPEDTESLLKAVINALKSKFDSHFMHAEYCDNVLRFIESAGGFINPDLIPNEKGEYFELNISDKSRFTDFFELYNSSFYVQPYLNFTWRNLSSGERASLSIYSRFYSLCNKANRRGELMLKKNLFIIIDEGDLYMHPDWQKQFLYNLLKFLPAIYDKTADGAKRNIQIIVTSNNPVSVSDLPNSNLVFLEKQEKGIRVLDSLDDKKLTFAANIHTLYTDSFFMKGGLIGEFAKHKINQIIGLLQGNRETILQNKEYIEKVISCIGEPLIKSKLTQMYTERLQLNVLDLQNRISKLETDVQNLQQRLT